MLDLKDMRSLKADVKMRTIYFNNGADSFEYTGYASMDYEIGQEVLTNNGKWRVTHVLEWQDTHVALTICLTQKGNYGWITDAWISPQRGGRATIDRWLAA